MFACFLCRQTTLAVYVLTLIGMLVFAFTLNLGRLWVVFITAGVLGSVNIGHRHFGLTKLWLRFNFGLDVRNKGSRFGG